MGALATPDLFLVFKRENLHVVPNNPFNLGSDALMITLPVHSECMAPVPVQKARGDL